MATGTRAPAMKRRANNGSGGDSAYQPPARSPTSSGDADTGRYFFAVWKQPRRAVYLLGVTLSLFTVLCMLRDWRREPSFRKQQQQLTEWTQCGDPLPIDIGTPPTAAQAEELSRRLDGCGLDVVLRWVAESMPGRAVQFTSFGPTGLVIIDRLSALGWLDKVPVVTIDTLHLFTETHELMKNLTDHYPSMKLKIYYPQGFGVNQQFKFDMVNGEDLWTEDFDRYTYMTKVEPTIRALGELNPLAWITGRRRSQGGERTKLPLVEAEDGRFKVNPLASWSSSEVWDYIHENRVPYNKLHDRGYASIGDSMNTRPINENESERAGRFMYSGKGNRTECGMHEHQAKFDALREAVANQPDKPKLPTIDCPVCTDVNADNFDQVVMRATSALLVEFYSPVCGHCQHFAPAYEEVAKRLQASRQMVAARWDMLSDSHLPKSGTDAGIRVSGYPTLYLVVPTSDRGIPRFVKHEGARTPDVIVAWVEAELANA